MVVSSSSSDEEGLGRQESSVSMAFTTETPESIEETRQIIKEQNELFEESLKIDKLKVLATMVPPTSRL